MLSVSQQELANHFQTQILPENRHWLCSQRNSVKCATTRARLTGWVCAPKAGITNPYNHARLRPVSNSWQHVWDLERCTSPSPAHVSQEAVKIATFLHSSQVFSVMSKAPSTDGGICGASYSCSEINPLFPTYGRKVDLPRSVIIQGELNHGSWALLCPRLAGAHFVLLFWDSRVWDRGLPHRLQTEQRTSPIPWAVD